MSTTKGPSPLRRRRLSRGLIAAGSERRPSREGNNNVVGDSLASLPQPDDDIANATSSIGDGDNSSIPPPSNNNVNESTSTSNDTSNSTTLNNPLTTANNDSSPSTNPLPTIPKLPPKSNYTNQLTNEFKQSNIKLHEHFPFAQINLIDCSNCLKQARTTNKLAQISII